MSIAPLVGSCLAKFERVLAGPKHEESIYHRLSDECGRLRSWAGNVGAHKSDHESLQYRLRDSTDLSGLVTKYLERLEHALQAAEDHETGPDNTEEDEADSDSGRNGDDSELLSLLSQHNPSETHISTIEVIITCLMRISTALRNPARDYCTSSDHAITIDQPAPEDVEHVQSKFPLANGAVVSRLATALSRHRQYIRVRREQHDLETGSSHVITGDEGSARPDAMLSASAPPASPSDPDLEFLPWPAEAADGRPFRCPLCCRIIAATTESEWRQHVFDDMPPYLCVVENCKAAVRQFSSRREWQQHLEHHNRHWVCPSECQESFDSVELLSTHMAMTHTDVDQRDYPALHVSCARGSPAASDPSQCPLCKMKVADSGNLESHLGHHFEQLVLLALPSSTVICNITLDARITSTSVQQKANEGDIDPSCKPEDVDDVDQQLVHKGQAKLSSIPLPTASCGIESRKSLPAAAVQSEPLGSLKIADRSTRVEGHQTTHKEDKAHHPSDVFPDYLPHMYGDEDNALLHPRDTVETKGEGNGKAEELIHTLPSNPSAAFDSKENLHKSTCLENTRVDLLNTIDNWVSDHHGPPIYWLNGVAGSGKSTVARTIARNYRHQGCLGGSFFFSRSGRHDSSAKWLFTTLSSELARSVPPVRRHICDAIAERRDIVQKGLRDQWEQLIIKPLTKLSESDRPQVILLVIDALDECKNSKDVEVILQLFARTRSLRELSIKVFLTGQSEARVRSGIKAIPQASLDEFILHEIAANVVDQDLRILFEVELAKVRHQLGPGSQWPGDEAIEHLVQLSNGLFIWAKTACSYLIAGRAPAATLRLTRLRNGEHAGSSPDKSLDALYLTVLIEAFPIDEYEEDEKIAILDSLRTILGALVTLKSYLSVQALASLLDIEPREIKETLSDLHTILQIPHSDDQIIRLHHPTFRDFLLDKKRCTTEDFWIDEQEAHTAIAHCCRVLMAKSLRWNICNLPSPSTPTEHIEQSIIEDYLPVELQYACLMWAEHLQQSNILLRDNDSTHNFLKRHFLHWIEALHLIDKGSAMTAILRIYQSLLDPKTNSWQLPFLKDVLDAMSSFRSQLKQTPLQLYCAPLMYIVPSNRLRKHFWSEVPPQVQRFKVIHADDPEVEGYHYQNDIVYTEDGQSIVYGAVDGSIRFCNVAGGGDPTSVELHQGQISCIAISPDGQIIASTSDGYTIKLFDLKQKRIQSTFRTQSGWVSSVTFSPDGEQIASGSMDGTVRLWDASSGQLVFLVESELGSINCVSFSPDGSLLAVAAVQPAIELYDIRQNSRAVRLDGHQSGVNSVRFSPDGSRLLSGSDDMTIRIWDTSTGNEIMLLEGHDHEVCTAIFAPTLPLVASGSKDKTVILWDLETGRLIRTLKGHTSGVCAVTFSPDEEILAAVAFNDEVRFWHTRSGKAQGKLGMASHSNSAVAHVGTGRLGNLRREQKGHASAVLCLAVAPNNSSIASGCREGILKVWSNAGAPLSSLEGHRGAILAVSYSTTSRYLVSASADTTAHIWEIAEPDVLHKLRGHSAPVFKACFTEDETKVVSCARDSVTNLWDVASGSLLKTIDNHAGPVRSIALAPDNKLIATCSDDRTIHIWHIEAKRLDEQLLFENPAHEGPVTSIAFSGDNKMFLSCSEDTTVKIWHRSNWTCTKLEGHKDAVVTGAFSSDNRKAVSASTDGTVIIWDLVAGGKLLVTLWEEVTLKSIAFSQCGGYIRSDRGSLKIPEENDSLATDLLAATTMSSRSVSAERASSTPSRPSLARRAELHTNSERGRRIAAPTVFARKNWVCYDSQPVFWLPEDHGVESVVTCGQTTVFGHTSGSITFLG